jgi:hypothetical protein
MEENPAVLIAVVEALKSRAAFEKPTSNFRTPVTRLEFPKVGSRIAYFEGVSPGLRLAAQTRL